MIFLFLGYQSKWFFIEESKYIQNNPLIKSNFLNDFAYVPNFITSDEESSLVSELQTYLDRRKYEFNHWDDVSLKYNCAIFTFNLKVLNNAIFVIISSLSNRFCANSGKCLTLFKNLLIFCFYRQFMDFVKRKNPTGLPKMNKLFKEFEIIHLYSLIKS